MTAEKKRKDGITRQKCFRKESALEIEEDTKNQGKRRRRRRKKEGKKEERERESTSYLPTSIPI